MTRLSSALIGAALSAVLCAVATAQSDRPEVGVSPWGADDEIGRLNLMTPVSQAAILGRISGGAPYDLSVEYFIGMPSWQAAGDPHYRIWMTHTPHGTGVDDPLGVGHAMNDHVSYTGAAVSMYTHTGTHIDALVHFGLNGAVWNGFTAEEHLGDRGWRVGGAEALPSIVARGVLIDLPVFLGVDQLSDGHRISRAELVGALAAQQVSLAEGDVVLIRTGRMQVYDDAQAYMQNPPGLGMEAARFLIEEGGPWLLAPTISALRPSPVKIRPITCRCTPIFWRNKGPRSSSLCFWRPWRATRSMSSPLLAAVCACAGLTPHRCVRSPFLCAREGDHHAAYV
ncbi:exported hypothetical protein [Oceanicaulis sp. 350]|nr:exported hypothetical protein [Oceanicaulis sp. 350]